jgi:hypothetical protein
MVFPTEPNVDLKADDTPAAKEEKPAEWGADMVDEQPSYEEATEADSTESQPQADETTVEDGTPSEPGNGFDEGMIARAQPMLGMNREQITSYFTPLGLSQFVHQLEQQAATAPKPQAPETKQEEEEEWTIPELNVDSAYLDDEAKASLKESWDKAMGEVAKEFKGLKKQVQGMHQQHQQQQQLSEVKSFDSVIDGLGHSELFGEGSQLSNRNGTSFINRSKVWDAVQSMKQQYPAIPFDELTKRCAHFVFGKEITNSDLDAQKTDTERKVEQRRKMASKPPTHRKERELPHGYDRALQNLTRVMRK